MGQCQYILYLSVMDDFDETLRIKKIPISNVNFQLLSDDEIFSNYKKIEYKHIICVNLS